MFFGVCKGIEIKRRKKNSRGENELSDLFLATEGCEAGKKISTMAYPRELEESTYEEIVRITKKNIRRKKIVAERTKCEGTR